MMVKIIISFILFSSVLIADNSFNDIEYMVDKVNQKRTVMILEDLKSKYPENSKDYEVLEFVEKYFMKKLPVDAYGTYSRMKLHNIIDNAQKIDKKEKQEYIMLTPDTDLNKLYMERQKRIESSKGELVEREIGGSKTSGVLGVPQLSEDKFMKAYEEMKEKGEL